MWPRRFLLKKSHWQRSNVVVVPLNTRWFLPHALQADSFVTGLFRYKWHTVCATQRFSICLNGPHHNCLQCVYSYSFRLCNLAHIKKKYRFVYTQNQERCTEIVPFSLLCSSFGSSPRLHQHVTYNIGDCYRNSPTCFTIDFMTDIFHFMFGHVDCLITLFTLEIDSTCTFSTTIIFQMHFKASIVLKISIAFITEPPIRNFLSM